MNPWRRYGGVCAIAALLSLPGVGSFGQVPPAPPPPAASTASPQNTVEQRIRSLQAQLHITDAQVPLWTALAQTMRDNATSTDTMFRQRASAASSMTALENMKSYAQVARAYADNTEKLASTFEALYGVLSDQQKQMIDTVFRQQSTPATKTQPVRR